MDLHIPEKWEAFISSQIQIGRFASKDEVVENALKLLQHNLESDDESEIDPLGIEDLLVAGLDSGAPIRMTPEKWKELWAEGERRVAERKARNTEQPNA